MRRPVRLALLIATFLLAGCYHQVVRTGATPAPGDAAVNRTANVFFFGLAGTEIDARTDCPGGVAVIETQQTFLNGLVSILTLGIYTPRTVTIRCASGQEPIPDALALTIGQDASIEQARATASRAINLAKSTQRSVVVRDLR